MQYLNLVPEETLIKEMIFFDKPDRRKGRILYTNTVNIVQTYLLAKKQFEKAEFCSLKVNCS